MAVTTPPVLTDIPDFPQLADRADGTYNSKAYAFGTHMANTFNDEISAVAANIFANATDAAEKATIATGGASTATEKANIATSAATIAASAKTDIEALYDQFDDRYLGAKSSDPTLDNDGNALQDGAFYINSVSGYLRAYTAAGGWVQGVSAVSGVSSINSATGAVTLKTLNGASLLGAGDIVLSTDAIRAPSNVTPAAAATNGNGAPTLTGSPYYSLYGLPMAAAQFQVSTAADFSSTVVSTGDVAGSSISYLVPSGTLAVSSIYYWRVRYKDSDGIYSAWSSGTSFTTAAVFADYIATPAATPALLAPFEGGYYMGMIWNELVQTATSTVIGTGSKVFAVADMSATPLVYAGQTLEVRSRANPANKMIGVVTAALGASLTINVTSVGGSGTFTDWSVMARYRLIKAPKSTETSLAYKNSNDASPAACGTLTEGWKATLAMVAAGNATVYPAAHYCRNLTSGGKTDWYLGARDENELDWRNAKPTTTANYTSADRPTGATPDYKNLGSLGDVANTHGLNNNSSPAGAAYTSGSPAQTANAAFQTGGAEAFQFGSPYYWSASEYSATGAWNQYWYSSNPGYQNSNNKTNAYVVRAVRRSII